MYYCKVQYRVVSSPSPTLHPREDVIAPPVFTWSTTAIDYEPGHLLSRSNWTGQPQDAPGAYRYAGNWNPASSNALSSLLGKIHLLFTYSTIQIILGRVINLRQIILRLSNQVPTFWPRNGTELEMPPFTIKHKKVIHINLRQMKENM